MSVFYTRERGRGGRDLPYFYMVDIPIQVRELARETESSIKAWLIFLGVSQEELAIRLNVSQPAVSQYCRKITHRRSTLESVASALELLPEQLDFDPTTISLMVFK